jgi:hypothetical protein
MELVVNNTNNTIVNDSTIDKQDSDGILDLVYIYVCSFFVVFGFISNFISFFVFLKASRRAPTIVTKNLLIVFTISNSLYLVIFWYYGKYKLNFQNLIKKFKLNY